MLKSYFREIWFDTTDFQQVLECYIVSEHAIFLNTTEKKIKVFVEVIYKKIFAKFQMVPVIKIHSKHKRATSSDTAGKKDMLVNEMKKIGRVYSIVSWILGFSVFRRFWRT